MIPSIPAIIKVLLVFVLILALNKARLTLSLSLIAGSLVLGFWMNLGPVEVAGSMLKSLAKLQTISLILIVGFILVLSRRLHGHDALPGASLLPGHQGLFPGQPARQLPLFLSMTRSLIDYPSGRSIG